MARAQVEPEAVADPEVVPERRLRMSYAEWQRWFGEERHFGEWVDGAVIVFMPPKIIHQAILVWLLRLLADYVDRLDLGQVFCEPTEMWLPGPRAARLPDIFFVATAHLDRVTEERLEGPADLVVEIVSADSVTRVRRDKFDEYAAVGIPEYWLIDPRPRRRSSAFYRLDRDGTYREGSLDERGRYHSRMLPGFWLDPAWLWQDPRPKPNELLPLIANEARDRARARSGGDG